MPRVLSSCPAAGSPACHPAAVPAGMPDDQREGLQEELIDIILHVLQRNPQLHYYQGYHDIVVTFLLVVGDRLATALVEKLSTHHLRYWGGRGAAVSPLRAHGGLWGQRGLPQSVEQEPVRQSCRLGLAPIVSVPRGVLWGAARLRESTWTCRELCSGEGIIEGCQLI